MRRCPCCWCGQRKRSRGAGQVCTHADAPRSRSDGSPVSIGMMQKQLPEVTLSIALLSPPVGVPFSLQLGKASLVDATVSSNADLAFTFSVGYLLTDESLDFRGPFVQGPRGGRFVYICCGELVDPAYSAWRRRVKIPLGGISAPLLSDCVSQKAGILRAAISGRSKDGGPPAATVPLIEPWTIITQ